MLDLISFWTGAWNAREFIPVSYGALVFGLTVTGLYYMAASLVFPDEPDGWPDLDAYYLAHRRQVLAAVWLCNTIPFTLMEWLMGSMPGTRTLVLIGLYWALMAVAFISRSARANLVALCGLISLYLFYAVA